MRVATYRERVPMRWVVMLYMILCMVNPGWGAVASLLEQGNSLFYEERYTEAIAVYQEVIRTEPTNTNAYYQLGNVHAARGDYEQAIEAYRSALRFQPEPALAYVVYQELGAIYGKRGQDDAAIAAFEAARELAPDDPHIYYPLGLAYRQSARYREALTTWQTYLRLSKQALGQPEGLIEHVEVLLPDLARKVAAMPLPVESQAQRYRLTVRTTPVHSSVTLLRSDVKYQPGVALAPGHYEVLVEQPGYIAQRHEVTLRDQDVTFEVNLERERYALIVQVTPDDSIVKVLTTEEIYQTGLRLAPGHYQLLVERDGYYPQQRSVVIDKSAVTLTVTLDKKIPLDTTAPTIVITSHDISGTIQVPSVVLRMTIWGQVTDASDVIEVGVNGQETTLDAQGHLAAEIALNMGDNPIVVTAMDAHRNVGRISFTVHRSLDSAFAGRRIALVIGNANYATMPLRNPVNDAADMGAALNQLGFNVTSLYDATLQQMEDAIDRFSQQLGQGGTGLLYYAGHGVQLYGTNYLIPVDIRLREAIDMKYKAVNVGWVLERMGAADNELNIVILDACRDNPFPRAGRSIQRGLAMVQAARGTLIAYATAPGDVALDGDGRNGVYTKHLMRYMTEPKLAVEQMFKRVRIAVQEETQGQQTPWESSSLLDDFYFAKR